MSYRLHSTAGVILIETGEHIAPVRSDARWLAYQDWVKTGNVPEPAEPNQWPIDELRARAMSYVSQELRRRTNLPITVATMRFDADGEARETIAGLINRIRRGDGLTAGWAGYRDADNVMRWADLDAAAVLVRLRALATAIEDRRQALLLRAWQWKAEIETADRAALEVFDARQQWQT